MGYAMKEGDSRLCESQNKRNPSKKQVTRLTISGCMRLGAVGAI